MGNAEFNYDFREPNYDFGGVPTYEYESLSAKWWEINMKKAYDVDGFGETSLLVDYLGTEAYYAPDILRLDFGVDMPTKFLSDGKIIF